MSKEFTKRILSTLILLPLVFYLIINGSYMLIFFTTICFIVAFYEWIKMVKNWFYKTCGFLFLVISFYSFYIISKDFFVICFIVLICSSTDVGGYVFGKLFKGPKLTKISPNKTYAGMIGGYFLSLICLLIINNLEPYSLSTIKFFILTVLISTVSQIGDIIISYFKRLSKIKNTGNLIPGHGGLLDRIDGMIFVFPFYYLIDFTGYL